MVPQSWILHSHEIYNIPGEVIYFIGKTMETWRVELTAGKKSLVEVKKQRVILQGDALSPSPFVMAMMILNNILRECTTG